MSFELATRKRARDKRFWCALVTAVLVCSFAALALAQQSFITPQSLRTWLTYLASDELEGRATFSEGLALAGAYIADQLKEAGVKPGGDHGTYFQRVEVVGSMFHNHHLASR